MTRHYHEAVSRMDEMNLEADQLIENIRNIKFKTRDLKSAIRLLRNAISKLAELSSEWSKFTIFFKEMQVLLNSKFVHQLTNLHENLQDFMAEVE